MELGWVNDQTEVSDQPALPARLLVDDNHAYILKDFEGVTLFEPPEVGDNVPLVTVYFGWQPISVKCSPHFEVRQSLSQKKLKIKNDRV